jgi:hypothetical protein
VLHTTRSVRYLGVILDAELPWREHAEIRIRKSHISFCLCCRTLGKRWGLELKIVELLYTGVVRPLLIYMAVMLATVRTALVLYRCSEASTDIRGSYVGHSQDCLSCLQGLECASITESECSPYDCSVGSPSSVSLFDGGV